MGLFCNTLIVCMLMYVPLSVAAFDLTRQNVHTVNASLNKVYNEKVGMDTSVILSFNVTNTTTLNNRTLPVRLTVRDYDSDLDTPLLVSVRQPSDVMAFTVPLTIERIYAEVERTICPSQNYPVPSLPAAPYVFAVDLSSSAKRPVMVSIEARLVEQYYIPDNTPITQTVGPSTPHYMFYMFKPEQHEVVIEVTSDDDVCAVVSIQDPDCPVFDLSRNVQFSGRYQTMTKLGALTVTREEDSARYSVGFHLVLIVKDSDYECSGIDKVITPVPGRMPNRSKQFTVEFRNPPGRNSYFEGVFMALGVIAAFYIITILFCCACRRSLYGESEELCVEDRAPLNTPTTEEARSGYGAVDGEPMQRANDDDEIRLAAGELYVSDLAKRGQKYHGKKAGFFHKHLLVVAVFYGLPVIQLVLVYLNILNNTGDLDLCYYNLRCSRPWFVFTNFNNVFSNIGYIMLAILFLCIVSRRHNLYDNYQKKHGNDEVKYGIPQHFGLLYAMGIAYAMEGVLSASYHVCPSAYNFQFDTAFMYVLAVLQMLKLYQARHPDVSPNASSCCLALALIIFLAVIGVFFHVSLFFWIVFTAVYILFSFAVALHFYSMGRWKLNFGIFPIVLRTILRNGCRCYTPRYKTRFVLLTIGTLLNLGGAVYGAVMRPSNFATFMLEILIGNLFLYAAFYVLMKLRYGEGLSLLTALYTVLALLCWVPALYLFTHGVTDWKLTPSQSRALNKPCLVFDFYDNHDIWHFLSASAIFFSFMALLTLDDNVQKKPTHTIHVF